MNDLFDNPDSRQVCRAPIYPIILVTPKSVFSMFGMTLHSARIEMAREITLEYVSTCIAQWKNRCVLRLEKFTDGFHCDSLPSPRTR